MDLGLDRSRRPVPRTEAVILLDTNAVIWLEQGHPRARPLTKDRRRLYVSPATLLELQFLHETGRVRIAGCSTTRPPHRGFSAPRTLSGPGIPSID